MNWIHLYFTNFRSVIYHNTLQTHSEINPLWVFSRISIHGHIKDNRAASPQNLSSGFPTKWESNQPAQLQRLYRKNEISPVASLRMKLSKKRTTKALIRLRGCAGWSAPVLFATPQRQVYSRRGPIQDGSFIPIKASSTSMQYQCVTFTEVCTKCCLQHDLVKNQRRLCQSKMFTNILGSSNDTTMSEYIFTDEFIPISAKCFDTKYTGLRLIRSLLQGETY